MPLLQGKPLEKVEIPSQIKQNDKIFHCELTDEVFKNYAEYCERIILCNSLIWTCSLTGKPNLTYEEALNSEIQALQLIKEFPLELRIPVLYIGSLTKRRSFADLANDVYLYVKDRYFIGEIIEVSYKNNNHWKQCHVLQILEPTPEEFEKSDADRAYVTGYPAHLYKYEVEELNESEFQSKMSIVTCKQIKRKKAFYNRDRNKLFLKQHVELKSSGLWSIKESSINQHGIHRLIFKAIFVGSPPEFPKKSSKINSISKTPKKQENIEKYLTNVKNIAPKPQNNISKTTLKKGNSPQKVLAQKVKDKYKKGPMNNGKSLEEKNLEKERISLEKERIRAQRRRFAEFLKDWNAEREDLECEDLKELPVPVPIICTIPNQLFGPFMAILEFLHSFPEVLSLKTYFKYGINFDDLENALTSTDVAGPFCDLVQLLLMNLFRMQEDEFEDVDMKSSCAQAAALRDPGLKSKENDAFTLTQAAQQATLAAKWTHLTQGVGVSKLTLDTWTVSEVLRLHLLSSGARCSDRSHQYRSSQRGELTSAEEPGLTLRIQNPHLLEKLATLNITELSLEDKLLVLQCLVDQLLTYAAVRNKIENHFEKGKKITKEIRCLQNKQKRDAKARKLIKKETDSETVEAMKKETDSETVEAMKKEIRTETVEAPSPVDENQDTQKNIEEDSEDHEEEIKNLKQQMIWALSRYRHLPLGRDRAYRRYWVFNSISGLFVENDEVYPGVCLPHPTPSPPAGAPPNTPAYVRHLFEYKDKQKMSSVNGGGGSDKENDDANKSLTQRRRSQDPILPQSSITLSCTADFNSCPIHGPTSSSRSSWSFFYQEDSFNSLCEALNKRGFRETDLQQTLVNVKEMITKSILRCPTKRLNPTIEGIGEENDIMPSKRKSSRLLTIEKFICKFPENTPQERILELSLREQILEFEEKLFLGHLGSLKVWDRTAWRSALEKDSYDQQCDHLVWGQSRKKPNEVEEEEQADAESSGTPPSSRPGTPDSELNSDINNSQIEEASEIEIRPQVRQLANAILQVEQGVDDRYMQKPLNPAGHVRYNQNIIQRWECSLMTRTNFSQLFLYLSTLEQSIKWSCSTLNANCRLCRRKGDPEKMLLCDKCNKGHHIYCLKPKLKKIPTGNWYCPKCLEDTEKERVRISSIKKVVYDDTSDEEEYVSHNNKKEANLDTSWNNTTPLEVCATCNLGGEVICCDGCPALYHIECAQPPLRKVPRGDWFCHKCRNKNSSKTKKDKKSNKKNSVNSKTSKSQSSQNKRKRNSPTKPTRNSRTSIISKAEDSDETPMASGTRRSNRRNQEIDLDLPLNNAALQDLLKELMHHSDSWPFLRPVHKTEAPDYHLIIKRPMDLGTILNKLNMLNYRNNSEFLADTLLVFENCRMYNQPSAAEYKAGIRLRKYFEKRCQELGLQLIEEDLQEPPAKRRKLSNSRAKSNISNEDEEMDEDQDIELDENEEGVEDEIEDEIDGEEEEEEIDGEEEEEEIDGEEEEEEIDGEEVEEEIDGEEVEEEIDGEEVEEEEIDGEEVEEEEIDGEEVEEEIDGEEEEEEIDGEEEEDNDGEVEEDNDGEEEEMEVDENEDAEEENESDDSEEM